MNKNTNDNNQDKINDLDNRRLEELMEIDPTLMLIDEQKEFLKLIKNAKFILPVKITEEIIEEDNIDVGGVVQTKLPPKTDFIYLTKSSGEKTLGVFTSEDIMNKLELKYQRIVMHAKDLANVLMTSGDFFSTIMINPQTEHSIEMNIPSFLELFKEGEDNPFLNSLKSTLYLLKNNSIELDNHYMFYLRSEYEIMASEAKDNIFVNKMPLALSSNPEFQAELPILHKIMMIQGQKVLYTGNPEEEQGMNILLAPGCQFQKHYDENEDISVWRCINQPFYDE